MLRHSEIVEMLINSHICNHQFSFIQQILRFFFFFILFTKDQHCGLNTRNRRKYSLSPLSVPSVGGGTAYRLCEGHVANSLIALGMEKGNSGSGVPAPVYRGSGEVKKASGQEWLLELDL